MDIEMLMDLLARSGVTMILKVDDERMAEDSDPWTVVLSGAGLAGNGFIRAEAATLGECLQVTVQRLRTVRPDWDWLNEFA